MSVDFDSDEKSTKDESTPKDKIIARLEALFPSIEEVERLLKNPRIAPPTFLVTMNNMVENEKVKKTHNETVTWLYELLGGDQLLKPKTWKDIWGSGQGIGKQ